MKKKYSFFFNFDFYFTRYISLKGWYTSVPHACTRVPTASPDLGQPCSSERGSGREFLRARFGRRPGAWCSPEDIAGESLVERWKVRLAGLRAPRTADQYSRTCEGVDRAQCRALALIVPIGAVFVL